MVHPYRCQFLNASPSSGVGAAGAAIFLTQVHESHATSAPVAGRGPALLAPLLRLLDAPPKREIR